MVATDARLELGVSDTGPEQSPPVRGLSAPIAAFVSVEFVAVLFWLYVGRNQWFHHDEWDFVAGRKAGDLGDLFRPHGPHWVTIPVLLYRAIFGLFGLRAYLPYRIPVLASHLVVAALLLVVMRRAAVRPWIAVAAASLFVAFGSGVQDIVDPFQVAFTAALAFGLVHLLLADHAGPVNRRDGYGLLAGLLALMCSGVGVCMVVVVGLAVILRRGWRLAALHTVPLGAIYLVWLAIIGRDTSGTQESNLTIGRVARFVTVGEREAYDWIAGGFKPLGLVLVLVIAGGLVCAVIADRRSGTLSRLAAPVALMAGSAVFLAVTASGRLFLGIDAARSEPVRVPHRRDDYPRVRRLPPHALASRWRWFLPVAIGIFLDRGAREPSRRHPRRKQHGNPDPRDLHVAPAEFDLARSSAFHSSGARHGARGNDRLAGRAIIRTLGRDLVGSPVLKTPSDWRLRSRRGPRRRRSVPPEDATRHLPRRGDQLGLYRNTVVVTPAPA